MKIYYKKFIFIFILIFSFAFFAQQAGAQEWVRNILDGQPLIPDACKEDAKNCGVKEFFQVLVNIFKLMLGLLGSLSLLFFVYGGFVWLFSRGNANMIQKGKDIIVGSVIGLSIVLGSWVIINFIIAVFTSTGDLDFNNVRIFDKQWWNFPG